ncbi:MAG: hypothetical protein RR263_00585 [Oscillospiraceae bacterium]
MKLTINTAPRTKKNNQEIHYRGTRCPVCKRGTPYISQSKVYKQYEQDCLRLITGNYRLKIDYPVNIKATYYVDSEQRIDITNLHSALHDILVAAGVLKDDNCKIVVGTDGSRVLVDKANPRTEIEITKTEGAP